MADWRPQWEPGVDLRTLTLSNVEGFLASRIDGHTTVAELSLLTNLPREQVNAVLARLVSERALTPAPETAPPAPPGEPRVQELRAPETPPQQETPPQPSHTPPQPRDPPPPLQEQQEETSPPEELPAQEDASPAIDTGAGGTHLAFYREHFHHLPADQRASMAATGNGAMLSALCFDPLPSVIRRLMENPHAGPEQARLIAAHHHNTAGLEFLLAHHELMRDPQLQRLLWRNPQLNEGQLRRLVQNKRLLEVWKLSVNREATSQTRTNTARLLRTRFAAAPAEERVELILSTEGRALAGLSGLPVDGKTTALLCARSYASVLLVQNLANWGSAPPALIAHLLKQPLVVRNPRLKNMLSRHANAPADAKQPR